MVIPMNRLSWTAVFFFLHCVHAQDRLRKISGDAAPEKAQEPIDDLDDFIPTIDSSVQLDNIPEPPTLIINLPVPPESSGLQQPSRPAAAPSSGIAPPSLKPSDFTSSTLSPPPSTAFLLDENRTSSPSYDDVRVTNDFDNVLPDPTDDLEEFQKADLLEQEKDEEVKDLVKKTTVNRTDDFYITSPATTATPGIQSDTIEKDDSFNFDSLFNKKIVAKDSTTAVLTAEEVLTPATETPEISTATSPSTATTTPSTTTTPTTTRLVTTPSHVHKKTCIHVEDLRKVDESVNLKVAGTKKGTIEVSVELGEDVDDADDSSEEEEETEAPLRHAREDKKPVWKKFEMNCEKEEDEKGMICKLWAAGGLCEKHRPTMFLFCRKTCLCVGPN